MAKDHSPGGFNRESGYKSDLEAAEEAGSRINTSFGSANHNVYVHYDDHTHEHFWYDPGNCQCGYHGQNVETANNHPVLVDNPSENNGTAEMLEGGEDSDCGMGM